MLLPALLLVTSALVVLCDADAGLTADAETLSAAVIGGITDRLDPTPTNVVYSPASITIALAALTDGANGRTQYELFRKLWPRCSDTSFQAVLRLRDFKDNEHMTLNMANGFFVEKTLQLKTRFEYLIRNIYQSAAKSVDFKTQSSQSERQINEWVEDKTKGFIKNLVSGIDQGTRLVIANAIHFKGDWASKFDKEKTQPMTFHIPGGSSVNVEMMEQHYGRGVVKPFLHEDYTMVGLPYNTGNDHNITMYFALPNDEAANIREIDWSIIHELTRSQPDTSEVYVQIPKFKVEHEPNLKAILRDNLGLDLIFSKTRADFSNIAVLDPPERLYVSDTFHKAYLEVNEEGTEAAAATAVVTASRGVRRQITLKLDRPFAFLLKHDDLDLPLFAGFVEKP